MKSSSILRGLHDPTTVAEISGSIYFHRNPHSDHYAIETVVIENGRLCVYYEADDKLPENLVPTRRPYIKLDPNLDAVQLIIKEYEPVQQGSTPVYFYVVTCCYTPAQGKYFRFRKYKADLDYPYSDNISYNVSDKFLVEQGFVCVDEIDADDDGSYVVYYKKD